MRQSDRSRPFRSIPSVVDDEPGVPDLRAKNPLRRPLSNRVKALATLLGTLVTIGGYCVGGGKWLLAHSGLAKTSDIAEAIKPVEDARKARDTVIDGKLTAIEARMAEMTKAAQAQAQATQALTRTIRKLRPTAKESP